MLLMHQNLISHSRRSTDKSRNDGTQHNIHMMYYELYTCNLFDFINQYHSNNFNF